jgi:hypothetical protein
MPSTLYDPSGDPQFAQGNENGDQYVMQHGDVFSVNILKIDLAADEGFVVIDLSDVANFPHTLTGKIRLYELSGFLEIESTGQYIVYFGVIFEVDATNGSTTWIAAVPAAHGGEATDRIEFKFVWEGGIDLEVSGGALVNVVGNSGHSGDVTWQTDVSLDSPVGDTSNAPGAGDLVMYVDEIGGTGTVTVFVKADYITEAAS